jgi:hypothetical protein
LARRPLPITQRRRYPADTAEHSQISLKSPALQLSATVLGQIPDLAIPQGISKTHSAQGYFCDLKVACALACQQWASPASGRANRRAG